MSLAGVAEAAIKPFRGETLGCVPVIDWACPVPFFGDITTARVATVGINPSKNEFLSGKTILTGGQQRLPTLESVCLSRWADARSDHFERIIEGCRSYFNVNPYWKWFRPLDKLLGRAVSGASYEGGTACHIDLVPWATDPVWNDLEPCQKKHLLDVGAPALAILLSEAPVELLLLNGKAVVDGLKNLVGPRLMEDMEDWAPAWDLKGGKGKSWCGTIDSLAGRLLGRSVQVLGWNWNLQSSFGVTNESKDAIAGWVANHSNL